MGKLKSCHSTCLTTLAYYVICLVMMMMMATKLTMKASMGIWIDGNKKNRRPTNSRVRISSWIFKLGFQVGFASKGLLSWFFEVLTSNPAARNWLVRKPSGRFPVQCSQQKNLCRSRASVLPFYSDVTI